MGNYNNMRVLDLMWTSIKSEGGDGDAIWLSKHTSLPELAYFIHKFNIENKTGWDLEVHPNHLIWGIDQEWALITDDRDFFESQPSWIILKIDY